MRERVAARPSRVLGEKARLHRGIQRVEQNIGVIGRVGDRLQQHQLEGGTDHRRGAKRLADVVTQPSQPSADHLTYAFGELAGIAGLTEMTDELVHEERVAVGLFTKNPRQCGRRIDGVVTRQAFSNGGLVQTSQGDALDPRVPRQIGERGRERVHAIELGIPVGPHDHHAHRLHRLQQVT